MAFALVAHNSSFSTTSNGYTSGAINTTTGAGADLLVVALSEGNGITNGVVTDSASNTSWTGLTIQTGNGKSSQIWYAWNAFNSSTHTVSVSGSANYPAMCFSAWSGSQTSADPADQQNGGNSVFASTQATGSITPTSNNQLVITSFQGDGDSVIATVSGPPPTVLDGTTDAGFGHQMAALAYVIQTTAAAISPTWTRTSGNSSLSAAIASFKAAGAAAAPVGKIYQIRTAVLRAASY